MKKVKRWITVVFCSFLALLFAAVLFRIFLAEHYPRETTQVLYTDSLAAYYKEKGGLPDALTQELRFENNFKYEGPTSKKAVQDGALYARCPIWVPGAGNFQITMRHNNSSIEAVASAYAAWDILEYDTPTKEQKAAIKKKWQERATVLTEEGDPFVYILTVSYCGEDPEAAVQKTFTQYVKNTTPFAMYQYDKLVFEGIPAQVDGKPVRWMRIEAALRGEARIYSTTTVFETEMEVDGVMLPVETEVYLLGKDEAP